MQKTFIDFGLEPDKLLGFPLVRVYRNLHRDLYSVQAKVEGRWRVVGHLRALLLRDARFVVRAASRDRVRRTGKKTVHAWVEGRPHPLPDRAYHFLARSPSLHYNPYKHDSFVREDGTSILHTEVAMLVINEIVAPVKTRPVAHMFEIRGEQKDYAITYLTGGRK